MNDSIVSPPVSLGRGVEDVLYNVSTFYIINSDRGKLQHSVLSAFLITSKRSHSMLLRYSTLHLTMDLMSFPIKHRKWVYSLSYYYFNLFVRKKDTNVNELE